MPPQAFRPPFIHPFVRLKRLHDVLDVVDFVGLAIPEESNFGLNFKQQEAAAVRQRLVRFDKVDEYLLSMLRQTWHFFSSYQLKGLRRRKQIKLIVALNTMRKVSSYFCVKLHDGD